MELPGPADIRSACGPQCRPAAAPAIPHALQNHPHKPPANTCGYAHPATIPLWKLMQSGCTSKPESHHTSCLEQCVQHVTVHAISRVCVACRITWVGRPHGRGDQQPRRAAPAAARGSVSHRKTFAGVGMRHDSDQPGRRCFILLAKLCPGPLSLAGCCSGHLCQLMAAGALCRGWSCLGHMLPS